MPGKFHKRQRFMSKRGVLQGLFVFFFFRIKGETPPRHAASGFSLSRFLGAQPHFIPNSWPHVALFLSPQPSEPLTTCPLLNLLSFYLQVQKLRLVQEPGPLGSAANLLPKVTRDTKTHFEDVNTRTFTLSNCLLTSQQEKIGKLRLRSTPIVVNRELLS